MENAERLDTDERSSPANAKRHTILASVLRSAERRSQQILSSDTFNGSSTQRSSLGLSTGGTQDENKPTARNECTICCMHRANAVIYDCGHGGVCYSCGVKILEAQHTCPFCRCRVKAVYRVHQTTQQAVVQASNAAVYTARGARVSLGNDMSGGIHT